MKAEQRLSALRNVLAVCSFVFSGVAVAALATWMLQSDWTSENFSGPPKLFLLAFNASRLSAAVCLLWAVREFYMYVRSTGTTRATGAAFRRYSFTSIMSSMCLLTAIGVLTLTHSEVGQARSQLQVDRVAAIGTRGSRGAGTRLTEADIRILISGLISDDSYFEASCAKATRVATQLPKSLASCFQKPWKSQPSNDGHSIR